LAACNELIATPERETTQGKKARKEAK